VDVEASWASRISFVKLIFPRKFFVKNCKQGDVAVEWCVGDTRKRGEMLRTNPTRIDLKTDDLREYEERKKSWPKQMTNNSYGGGNSLILPESPVDGNRIIRNARIGYKQNN
jgi:hypothetical protein